MSPNAQRARQVVKVVTNYRGQRRTVLRQQIFDLMGRLSPVVAVDSGTGRYFLSTRDHGLSRTVFEQGSYDQDVMEHTITLAEKHVGRSPLLAGRTFVDVGANIGTSTVPALMVFGAARAVSIEPDADNYKLLRCNLIANDVDDRVRTVHAALSDRSGTGVLELGGCSWSDHRVRTRGDAPEGVFQESSRPTVEVPLVRFDDLAAELPLDLDEVGMVWIDVQGHEGHVLAGASRLLASDVPVAIEYWPYGLGRVDGLALLHELVAQSYSTVVDVRASLAGTGPAELPASRISTLEHRYPGEAYTDLLLLK
jgi:FkbM family methyltransferase